MTPDISSDELGDAGADHVLESLREELPLGRPLPA